LPRKIGHVDLTRTPFDPNYKTGTVIDRRKFKMFNIQIKPLFDLNQVLAASHDLFRFAPYLTCVATAIALSLWGVYMVSGKKDFLVLAVCAVAYAIVPLM